MNNPNFFIIGAPKCGTTSLAAWLSEHPQIYIPYKEIHYFSTDLKSTWVPDRAQYEELFSRAEPQHKALGDASVWYLYSKVAVQNIEKFCQNPRYIVCLRNPVDMAYSLHEQQLVEGNENIESFERAWELSEARLLGKEISPWCLEPKHLVYKEACSLGRQLERLFQMVPKERVHLVILDDVKENPGAEYRKVLQFLNVDDDGRVDFSAHNPAKRNRFSFVRRMTLSLGNIKRRLGLHYPFGVLKWINQHNMQYRPRPELSPDMRRRLQDYFKADVEKLGALIDRDFSGWINK
ncbi:MAG: sulfotransferase domain-containing protein [Methylomicrobium sp.]